MIADRVRWFLNSHAVRYDLVAHRHTSTSIDTARSARVEPERVAKCVVLRGEQGYWLGSMMVNTGLTQGFFIAFLVVGMIITWPDVPWTALLVGGIALTLLAPIFFHPFTRTLWVAAERHARRWSDATPSRYPRPIQDRISTESTDDTVA